MVGEQYLQTLYIHAVCAFQKIKSDIEACVTVNAHINLNAI